MAQEHRTFLVLVALLVIAGLLLSLMFSALVGGAVGYLVANARTTQIVQAELERIEQVRPTEPERIPRPDGIIPRPFDDDVLPLPEVAPIPPEIILQGAMLHEVVPDSPADQAGLRAGDVILTVDGKKLDEDLDLAAALQDYSPGDTVELTYQRGGMERERTVSATLGAHPEDPERPYLGVRYSPLRLLPLDIQP